MMQALRRRGRGE